jgi:hypothetical protein
MRSKKMETIDAIFLDVSWIHVKPGGLDAHGARR